MNRNSVGRLLRALEDCELFHMEAAIASLENLKTENQLESLLHLSRRDDFDVLERTAEGRVLSLSDHKRIARLQAALTLVRNASNASHQDEGAATNDVNRNLVCAVAGAAMTQSLRECTASRTNCCIWGLQAEKLHVLLDWMTKREQDVASPNCDHVRQLLLEWMQPMAEKQKQLAACLTLFELLQRRRRKLQRAAYGTRTSHLLGDRAVVYLKALRGIVDQGTVRVADLHRVKLSKLALIALETLTLLCGDVAVQYMMSDEVTKRKLIDEGLIRATVKSIHFILAVLRQWHLHSVRRQFLCYALHHLQLYVTPCNVILSSVKEGESKLDTSLNDVASLDVLCWHWIATAPLLCTRTDASLRDRKTRSFEVLTSILEKWSLNAVQFNDSNGTITNPEMIYAQLRYVCVLLDSIGGMEGCLKAFSAVPEETKTYFVFFFLQGLSTAIKHGAETTVLWILKIIRALLLPNDVLNLFSSRDQEQEFLSQLLCLHGNSSAAHQISDSGLQGQAELELLVADFIISRNLFITEILRRLHGASIQSDHRVLSLVQIFLYQLENAATDTQLHKHWRKVLTPGVVRLVAHENHAIRRVAVSCLPSLDALSCIAELCSSYMDDAGASVISSMLGYIVTTSTRSSFEAVASRLLDVCQFGGIWIPDSKILASPRDWNDYVMQESTNANIADEGERREMQEKSFSLCFGPNGWSNHLQSISTRSALLRLLLDRIFGSPRDAALLRMLREFVACGWVDNEVCERLGTQLTVRMMSLPRLSEEILDDNSFSGAKSLEGLLFSRLAPLLVLRMLPRNALGTNNTKALSCGLEDLDHLNEYVKCQLQFALTSSDAASEGQSSIMRQTLFHILARSMVDPLEFKEVKMVATECLSKFPLPRVLPFVLAYLIAFLREAMPNNEFNSSSIVEEESVPNSCGMVTAKLMVYYLNRVFSEDDWAYKDKEIVAKILVVLVQIMEIPCVQAPRLVSTDLVLTDLQRGCIDCIALILVRLSALDSRQKDRKMPIVSASSLMDLLMGWIFEEKCTVDRSTDSLDSRVQELLHGKHSGDRLYAMSPQGRICSCNVFLSAISRAENEVLAYWKSQGFVSRIALAIDTCSDDVAVAGGFQILFSFLYKSSNLFAMEDKDDLQLVRTCFELTAARLETTRCEKVAMNGLKTVGALVSKLPGSIETSLPPAKLQQFIDKCLINLRDRRMSPVVSELAQSLLQAMTPP